MPEIKKMETKHIPLGNIENNRLVNIVRVLFGAVCIAIAVFWMIFNLNSVINSGTIWITILFLAGFGFYLIWAGFGKAERFIEIGNYKIALKKYIFRQPIIMDARETDKIQLYPLKIIFLLKSGKKVLLRLGTMYYETNETIKDEIAKYAEENKITTEVFQEEI